jgi:hypothetical protein
MAFYGCYSLTSVEIPDSVTSIGYEAFGYCAKLTSITVSEDNENYQSIDSDLYSKDGTTLIQYAIGKTATSFTIRDGITSIGNRAFYGCSSLTSVEIPDSITSIDDHAFDGCYSLTSVEIPDSVTSIGYSAFYSCYSLTSVVIGNGVERIDDNAFASCGNLTSVEIPDSVTSIGNSAFADCVGLTDVRIPNRVGLGCFAFAGCFGLQYASLGGGYIDEGAFYGCNLLLSVDITGSVTDINATAFQGCTNLLGVTFGGDVENITYGAFTGCTNLKYIDLSNISSVPSSFNGAYFVGGGGQVQIKVPENLYDDFFSEYSIWGNGDDAGYAIVTEFDYS